MQRGQRRAQIVGEVGDQFAPLLVLAGQLAPLLGDAAAHLGEGAAQHGDLVTALAHRILDQRGGQFAVGIEAAHRFRQVSQRPGDQAERQQAHQQSHQGDDAGGP